MSIVGFMRIMMEVPAGLKLKALELAAQLEKEGNEVFINCETFYGACDLKEREAKALGCDKIIHFGHNQFKTSEIPVEYREVREGIDVIPILKEEIDVLSKYEKIGLISSLQFLDSLGSAKEFLEGNGKKVEIGEGKQEKRVLEPGQVLGCDLASASQVIDKVDCILYVGSGKFHALGEGLKTEKPVFILDVEKGEIKKLDSEKFLKQKFAAIGLAEHAHVFGILVSTKEGQLNAKLAENMKKNLEKKGKKAFILVMDEVSQEKLEGLQIDCYINTACPRIAIENRGIFKKPMLNIDEFKEVRFK